jgi:hypothetical protein
MQVLLEISPNSTWEPKLEALTVDNSWIKNIEMQSFRKNLSTLLFFCSLQPSWQRFKGNKLKLEPWTEDGLLLTEWLWPQHFHLRVFFFFFTPARSELHGYEEQWDLYLSQKRRTRKTDVFISIVPRSYKCGVRERKSSWSSAHTFFFKMESWLLHLAILTGGAP